MSKAVLIDILLALGPTLLQDPPRSGGRSHSQRASGQHTE